MSLRDNFDKISKSVENAVENAGRAKGSVKLIAVSKTVDSSKIREMYGFGARDFAESRPQVLRDKVKELETLNDIKWHFIGHLQSNKIKYVYPVVALVHSIDRRELLDEFAVWAQKTGKKCPVLLEVHISGEEAKQGFEVSEVLTVIKDYKDSANLDIRGLMGMAPLDADEEQIRICFKKLHDLFTASKEFEGSAYKAQELSMGMSGDFPVAIAEGATMVRIGTSLFKTDSK